MKCDLDTCYRFGQLMGVAIRSKNILDMDVSEHCWRQLLGYELNPIDLASYDYTAWMFLQFRDPTNHHTYDQDEFNQYFHDLFWSTTLSDGKTEVELKPNGKSIPVSYHERWEYAGAATLARFDETRIQIDAIRQGLFSVVPKRSLALLTWNEVELRVCGEPHFNIAGLKKRTVYAPRNYTTDSAVIKNFWLTLESFKPAECRKFLQFSWARSRLPPESDPNATWRMKINILESASENDLPSAETCFFNVSMPKYSSLARMREKLLLSITLCSSITS